MDDSFEPGSAGSSAAQGYPQKPVMVERKTNALTRSLISLFVYALLFYFLFEQNLAYIAAIMVVIIIHEAGHFLFMKMFNYSNVKIFIVPLLGAFTSGRKQDVSQLHLSLIILAGPVPGIIIGTVIHFINADLHNETLNMLATSFLYINLLNCLPFYPLDGGRLIETLFFKQNHLIRLIFGIISIMALALLFLYSPVMLIVPALIGLELYNESKHQKIRDYLKNEKINYHVDYESLPDKDYWLIRDCLIFSFPKKYAGIQPGVYQYSIAEPLLIQHTNSVLQVNIVKDLTPFKKLLVIVFYLLAFIGPMFFLFQQF
jgi:stage IV sporulation protein FB